ncbi:DUF4142 domain-containing protein [Chitinophaga sp. HK235]|uniref:DUF4142 domain-containing protein n=1 Tax=Chitinophaga sp. HK235 TaxID=2952571 RepID=UPI001BA96626|nr:DUF4142 domain-containing protein [Chitinophaga sp. HK235]
MKKSIFFVTALLGAWMLHSCGNRHNPQHEKPEDSANAINETMRKVDDTSSAFAVDAADKNMMEIQLGKLAQEKAENPRVKAFATMMVEEHTKANDQLKTIASRKGIVLPTELSTASKNFIDRWSKKKVERFDKEYIREMVDHHNQDVKDFDNAANNLQDETLKEWARKMLPVLMVHQDSARAISESL